MGSASPQTEIAMEDTPQADACCACFTPRTLVVQMRFTSDVDALTCFSQLLKHGSSPELCLGENGAFHVCHRQKAVD